MNLTKGNSNLPFTIKGDWDKQAKNLKKLFPALTDADLKYEPGKTTELVTRMATRLNKKKVDIINIIEKQASAKE